MKTELFDDLEVAKPHSSTRISRLRKPIPARIDSDDSPEDYQKRIDAKLRNDQKIEDILRARADRKLIQDTINAVRKERAKIKGRSKASNDERSLFDLRIKELIEKKLSI